MPDQYQWTADCTPGELVEAIGVYQRPGERGQIRDSVRARGVTRDKLSDLSGDKVGHCLAQGGRKITHKHTVGSHLKGHRLVFLQQ